MRSADGRARSFRRAVLSRHVAIRQDRQVSPFSDSVQTKPRRRVLGSCKMYLDTRDTGFGSHVSLDGYWEPWITVFVARQLRPGMVAIDVGANYGYYSLLFAALVGDTGHVYAIEPNPEIVSK